MTIACILSTHKQSLHPQFAYNLLLHFDKLNRVMKVKENHKILLLFKIIHVTHCIYVITIRFYAFKLRLNTKRVCCITSVTYNNNNNNNNYDRDTDQRVFYKVFLNLQ